MLGRIRQIASRVVILLENMMSVSSDRVRGYLKRVAECLVLGLSKEAAVMSRAALEAALYSRLAEVPPDELRGSVAGANSDRNPTLHHRLLLAENSDWLATEDRDVDGQSTYDAGRWLKNQGDEAVHVSPGLARM
jgi:hypothetical protein